MGQSTWGYRFIPLIHLELILRFIVLLSSSVDIHFSVERRESVLKEMRSSSRNGLPEETFMIQWKTNAGLAVPDFSNIFRELRDNDELFDVTLGGVMNNSNGVATQRAHKVVLSAYSPVFRAMFNQLNDRTDPFVFLKGVSENNLYNILEFIYNGYVNVNKSDMSSFLSQAEELQINGIKSGDYGESLTDVATITSGSSNPSIPELLARANKLRNIRRPNSDPLGRDNAPTESKYFETQEWKYLGMKKDNSESQSRRLKEEVHEEDVATIGTKTSVKNKKKRHVRKRHPDETDDDDDWKPGMKTERTDIKREKNKVKYNEDGQVVQDLTDTHETSVDPEMVMQPQVEILEGEKGEIALPAGTKGAIKDFIKDEGKFYISGKSNQRRMLATCRLCTKEMRRDQIENHIKRNHAENIDEEIY